MSYSTWRILVLINNKFRNELLPLIDLEARQEEKTRADIIRDILYSKVNYYPKKRSKEQLIYDYNLEKEKDEYIEDTCSKLPSIWVCVDRDFLDIYMMSVASKTTDEDDEELEKNYWEESWQIIQDHYFPAGVKSSSIPE